MAPLPAPVPAPPAASRLLAWYSSQLQARPVTIKVATCGVLTASADVVSQLMCDTSASGRSLASVDLSRAARFGACGMAITAPLYHAWFGLLARRFPRPGMRSVCSKIVVDLLVMAVPFNCMFITAVCTLEKRKELGLATAAQSAARRTAAQLEGVMRDYCFLWLPAQCVNFCLVPVPFQVLFMNGVSFWWCLYISWSLGARAGGGDKPA